MHPHMHAHMHAHKQQHTHADMYIGRKETTRRPRAQIEQSACEELLRVQRLLLESLPGINAASSFMPTSAARVATYARMSW